MDEDQETNQLPGTHNYAENEATTPTNQEETCSITEKEKAFLTSLEVDDKLQLGSDDYEHMLRSEDTAGSNSTSETSETDLVSAVQSAYNSSNFQNFTDYKQNLNLPEGWQLLTTGYNSRGNGYFGTALWNKKLRIIWIVHMATCFTYFNLLSINLLLSMWQALFRLDLGIVKMLLYEAQIKSAMTFTDNVKQMVQSNEDYLDIKLCVSDNSVGSWLARLSTYSAEHLRVKQQANKKYHFTRAKEITPNVHQQPFRIAVDDHLQLSDPNFSEKIHPTNTDNETFLRQSPFPRPKEMAMFAKAAYVELSTPNYEEELHLPDGWTFLTAVFNNSWGNCYFGVAFWNPALHQIVVAHRGTSPSLFNLKRNWSILYKTDYVGISKVQYVPQVNSAITFAEKIREAIADKPSIRLNFTGHSLGGWLAQVTTFSIKYLTPQADKNHFTLCPNSAKSYHPHTVVFETPGCKEMLLKMKTDFSPKYQTKVNIEKRLDITVYLSKPNLINTSNTHVGTIYAFNGNLYEWVDRLSFVSYIFQTHSIEHIVNAFASKSDDSELVQVVSDFPSGKDQRHKLEKCDDTSCSLSLFSEQELCLLNILETLQTEVKNLTANCYIEQKVAELPKIALDGDSYKLKLTDAKDLNDVVKFTKQSTTICLNEVLKACNLNTFDVTHKDLQFMDNFGLKEFILQSNQKLLQLVVDDLIVISAIHSILENCRVNNQIDSTLYLKWSHLERVLKFTDISVIFSMASVVIIETEQSSGFTKDIIKYTEQNKTEKCILILPCNDKISESFRVKEIYTETLNLEKTSQEKLLIQALSQNRPDISDMNVFYQDINEEIYLKNVIPFLQTERNTKFFISCSTREDTYAYLAKEEIEKFEKAQKENMIMVRNGNREDSEWRENFKKFCQENSDSLVIWVEIPAKDEVASKKCTCKCIYDNKLYISRKLQSRWFINKDSIKFDLLSNQLKDLCIIILEENNNHTNTLKEELNQVENVRFVSSMEEATQISKKSQSPHHILKFTCSQQIEWNSSVNSLHNIKRYILYSDHTKRNEDILHSALFNKLRPINTAMKNFIAPELVSKIKSYTPGDDISDTDKNAGEDISHFISEVDFITQTKKTVIIADEPGMGKTTTCIKLLHKLNNSPMIHIDLKNYTEDIRKLSTNGYLDLETVIQFLLKHTCHGSSKLDINLVKKALKENLGKNNKSMVLTLFFDGFDAIPLEGNRELHAKLLNLLQFLSQKTTARVWVTTRKHYLDMLQDGLLVFDTTFQKISESVQKEYLRNYWQIVLKLHINLDEDFTSYLKSYTDELYGTAKQTLDASIGRLMGVPLQMRMLLEVVKPKCNEDEKIDIHNIGSLYDAFVKSKFKIYFEDKSCSSKTETEKKELKAACLSKLKNLAFHNHFISEAEMLLPKKERDFDDLSECYRLGLIHQTNTTLNNREFLHLTFQEYFCAQKLFELMSDKCSPDIVDLLLSKVLLKVDYRIIRLFLNHQLQTNEVEIKDETFAEHASKMWKQERRTLFEISGYSCFTTLAEEGHESLMNYIITVSGDSGVKMLSIPNKHSKTPLALAIEEEHFNLVDSILDKVSNHRKEIVKATIFHTGSYKVRDHLLSKKLDNCNEEYFANIQKYLKPNFLKNVLNLSQIDNLLSKCDFFKNQALLVAASHGYYETVKHLVSRMKYLDYSNCEGQTALHLAAQKDYIQIIQLLLERGANCQILDYSHTSFLQYALKYSESSEMDYKYLEIIFVYLKINELQGNQALINCMVSYCQKQSDKQECFLKLLDSIIDFGVDVNKTDKDKRTLLMYACMYLLIDLVQYLINKGANVNLKDKTGKTALDHAIGNYGLTEKEKTVFLTILNQDDSRYLDESADTIELLNWSSQHCLKNVVEHLISKGVDVNSMNKALHLLIIHYLSGAPTAEEIYKVVNILTESRAEIKDSLTKDIITVLKYAQQYSPPDMIRYLIVAGADLNKIDFLFNAPLHSVLFHYGIFMSTLKYRSGTKRQLSAVLCILNIMTEQKANINLASGPGTTPLMVASQLNLPEVVEYLLSNGANIDATDKLNKISALHHAVTLSLTSDKKEPHTTLNVVRILIANGAKIDAVSIEGSTPLMFASENGFPEVVEYLISNGANVHATDKHGNTTLHYAVIQTFDKKEPHTTLNVVRILIANGAKIDAASKYGLTPLMLACENGFPEVVEHLLSNGANVNTTNEEAWTALHYAVSQTSDKKESQTILNVTRILIENGANIEAANNRGVTPLLIASYNGFPEVVKHLISNGANLNTSNEEGNTALHSAVYQTLVKKEPWTILKVARILIENGANVNAVNKNGETPLMLASLMGLPEVVEHLISNGANVNARYENGWRALHYALMQTSDKKEPQTILNVVRILVENGAYVDAAGERGFTPLMLVSLSDSPKVVEYLISNGANVNATNRSGWTALHAAVSLMSNKQELQTILNVAKILIENGAHLEAVDKVGLTPLMLASLMGLPEVVEHLLSNGANVNTTGEDGRTALHFAADQTLVKKEPQTILNVVRILIENGANVDVASKHSSTPLMLASLNGLPEVVEYLISNGANVNTTGEDGSTALHFAVIQTSDKKEPQTILNVVRILIENGANVDAVNKNGVTPLLIASYNGFPEVVKHLISNGANVNTTDEKGATALHYAADQTFVKKEPQTILNVARILIENGANIDAASKTGYTPLMLASLNGFPEVVEYLISNGANVNTTGEDGRTALHFAVIQTSDKKEPQTVLNVVRILIENGANVDAADKEGNTPLILASLNGLLEVVEYLISIGANVNISSEHCSTALLAAVDPLCAKKTEPQTILHIVRILVENGAKVAATDNHGDTPLMSSSASGLPKVVEYLISKGADITVRNKNGCTALHYAIEQKTFDYKKEQQTILHVAKILTENGVDIDAADKKGVTPLMLANEAGLHELVQYLTLKSVHRVQINPS